MQLDRIHALTGQVTDSKVLSFRILDSFVLPHIQDKHGNHAVVIVDDSKQFRLEPNTPEIQKVLSTHGKQSLFFYFVDKLEGEIKGYTLGNEVSVFVSLPTVVGGKWDL